MKKDVTAILRNLQIAPRKVELVADLIRGLSVQEARKQLQFNRKHAARPMLKLLNSAVANAEHNEKISAVTLRVKGVMVGQGPMLKRFMPMAFGRAGMIQKRMSHVKVVVEGEVSDNAAKKSPAKTKAKSVKGAAPLDMEKQPPQKQEGERMSSRSKKPSPVDPRGHGHERPTQHNKKIVKK